MWRKPGCDFSFSGLKTAVRLVVEKLPPNDAQAIADLCASFQRTVGDVLADRCGNALASSPMTTLVVAGGVAANQYLRGRLEELAASHGARLVAPPMSLCTDNAAMIAWAGIERLRLGRIDDLDFAPRPRWPLDPHAASGIANVMDFDIAALFPTPVVTMELPDAAALNAELRAVIAARQKSHASTQHSNLGGWQSSWDMDRWGGAPAIKLLAIGRNLPDVSRRIALASRPASPGRPICGPTSTAAAMPTSSIPIPAASGPASTMSTMAAWLPTRRWAASSNSWTRVGRVRRCTRRSSPSPWRTASRSAPMRRCRRRPAVW